MDPVRLDADALLEQAGWLRTLARHLVRDPDQADDLLQDTMRRALERPTEVSGPGGARTWLGRVMRNLASNRRRDDEVRVWHERAASRSEAWSSEDSEERVRIQRELADAVLELPEPSRSAIVLRYFEELAPRDVASRLGIRDEAARQRISRGLAQLRTRLDREHGSDRAAWCLMLVRLLERTEASVAPVVAGGIVMSSTTKLLLGALAVVAMAFFGTWRIASLRSSHARLEKQAEVGSLEVPADSTTTPPAAREPVLEPLSTGFAAAPAALVSDRELTGEVIDSAGRFVSQVLVEVFRSNTSECHFLDHDRNVLRTKVAEAETDAEGRFAVSLPVGKPFLVEMRSAGFAMESFGFRYAGEHLVARLHRAASIRGRVRTEGTSGPVAGARVRLWQKKLQAVSKVSFEVRTDESGGYAFEGLPPGEYGLSVVPREGSAPWIDRMELQEGVDRTMDFDIRSGPPIRGKVTDADTHLPIVDAEVGTGWMFEQSVRTNASGDYEFRGSPLTGDAELHVRAEGYGRREARVHRIENALEDRADFGLTRARTARGRVQDEAGRPIADAYIAAIEYDQFAEPQRMDWIGSSSVADGSFELRNLRPDGPHTLVAMKEGLGMMALAFPESESKESTIDLGVVVLPPPSLVQGVLVDEDGKGIPDMQVDLRGWNTDRFRMQRWWVRDSGALDHYLSRSARTDDQGRFAFTDLSDGDYRASVRWPGADRDVGEDVRVRRASVAAEVRLVLERGLSISGLVLDPDGQPVANAYVRATPESGSSGGINTDTDRDGRFVLRPLQRGTYGLRVDPRGRNRDRPGQVVPIEVSDISAGEKDVVLRVRRSASVDGIVSNESGDPIAGASVQSKGQGTWDSAMTDAHGRFRVAVGEDDTVDLEVQGPRKLHYYQYDGPVRVRGLVPGGESVVIHLKQQD